MITIANANFTKNGVNFEFSDQSVLQLLEKRIGVNFKKITRGFFVIKIIPLFIYCGASVVTIANEKKIHSYEIKVSDPKEFETYFKKLLINKKGEVLYG